MQNRGIISLLVLGFVLATGQRVMAEPDHVAPPAQQTPEPRPSSRSVIFSVRSVPMKLRLLTSDGKVLARVVVEASEGPIRISANRVKYTIKLDKEASSYVRLEGKVSIKTTRNGAEVTLLEMNHDDAIVEYTQRKLVAAEQPVTR